LLFLSPLGLLYSQNAAFPCGRAKFLPARFLPSQKKGVESPFAPLALVRIILKMCYYVFHVILDNALLFKFSRHFE
jgi:hypothetical protein